MLERDFKERNTLKNKLFTNKDFEFINTFYSDLDVLKNKLSIQKSKRALIVSLIDNLNNFINSSSFDYSINNDEFTQLLKNIETTFNNIDKNIKYYNDLENSINSLNKCITDLLADIESNKNIELYYTDKVKEIQSELNLHSIQMNNIKSAILLNEVQIDNFLNSPIAIKYLELFNLKLDISTLDNSKASNNIVKENTIDNSEKDKNISKTKTLIISEKKNKVYLPYTKSELEDYLEQYPDKYKSYEDVIKKEFILPLTYYQKHPVLARFRETYSLIRDREMKSPFEAFKFAIDLMFRYDLNPTIIAACKTQSQLEDYLDCLDHKQLNDFNDFEIRFEINPI